MLLPRTDTQRYTARSALPIPSRCRTDQTDTARSRLLSPHLYSGCMCLKEWWSQISFLLSLGTKCENNIPSHDCDVANDPAIRIISCAKICTYQHDMKCHQCRCLLDTSGLQGTDWWNSCSCEDKLFRPHKLCNYLQNIIRI